MGVGAVLRMRADGPTAEGLVLAPASMIERMASDEPSDHMLAGEAEPALGALVQAERATTFATTVDEHTMARARKGDLAALERLFRTFEIPVYNLARRLCHSPHDAEDVLQEAFLEVVRSIRRFRGEGSLAGWIRRITVNKALMKLRAQRARPLEEELDEATLPDEWPGASEVGATSARVDLETALGQLPDTARAVMWLHDVEGYSHDEIAAAWGKSVSFSKSQLSRAYARLRDWLGVTGREV